MELTNVHKHKKYQLILMYVMQTCENGLLNNELTFSLQQGILMIVLFK